MDSNLNETIPAFIVRNVSRSLVMAVDEALNAGAQRAYAAAKGMEEGHLPHAVGQMRHFHMNEAFHRSLEVEQADPTPLKGNSVVTGHAGVVRLARFNIKGYFWTNGRRSQTRRQMALANKAIEPLVQPDLFGIYRPATEAVAFFVACFSESLQEQPETPISIQIAVPDPEMKGWLFREPLDAFLQRYEAKPSQADLAMPKLKRNIGKRDKDGTAG